jgi:hypothetical protein
MSAEELKKYKPDSAKEFSFFGSSLVRLSSAVSGGLIASDHAIWSLITVGLAWLGHEVEQYFKLHEEKKEPQ